MKSLFSLLAVLVLVSGCNFAHDYPNKQRYYSADGVDDMPPPKAAPRAKRPHPYPLENIQEVCVGQWCQCSVD